VNSSRPFLLILVAIVLIFLLFELLRRRYLREKYAALWLLVGALILYFAIRPTDFEALSRFLGFGLPVNMAFAGGVAVLMLVSMQLSLETGRREDETQRLAEEVALLRLEIEQLRSRPNEDEPTPSPGSK
jgi:hypothetical protein